MSDEDAGPIGLADIRNTRTIVARVEAVEQQLEQLQPDAAAAAAEPAPDLSALTDRLDRQRADIEQLKTRYNELVQYLQQQLGGAQ